MNSPYGSEAVSIGRRVTTWTVLAAIYALAGKLGLALAFVNPSATAVWPPTGIALAAVLAFGPRVWPGILLGAFLTNELTAGTAMTSLLIAVGNTAEALLGAHLVARYAGGRSVFDNARGISLFVLLSAVVSTTMSATIGVTTLSVSGLAQWPAYWSTWLTWWLGDASGAMVITPAILLWLRQPRVCWSRAQWVELVLLSIAVVLIGWIVFGASQEPLGFLCIPIVIWAAYRFGQREAATATCVLSSIAIWGTIHGRGTFADRSINDTLLLLQAFMAVMSIAGLTIGAAVAGQRRAEDGLREANAELENRVDRRTTELRAALDDLRASDARFYEAQHVANVGSWEWTLADDREWWSDELYRICGFRPNTFRPTYQSFLTLLHPADVDRVSSLIEQARNDHEPFEFEHRIIRPDGEVRTLYTRGRVVVDVTGRVVRMFGTAQDITDRKIAEEIVSRSERRLQTIIDAEPACVKLISHDGTLLEMNRAGLEMLGATDMTQVVGRQVIGFVHPEDHGRFLELHRTVAGGSPARGEFRIIGLTGDERWVDSHLVPFDAPLASRQPLAAVLSVTSDITERKRLEDQLRQAQKMEAIGQLAGGIAHDFNNLLTAIGGYTELVLGTLDYSDARRMDLEEVAKGSHRATALTRQLLAFSRRQILQPSLVEVNGMVADVEKLLRRTIPESIELQLELGSVVEPVHADRSQLEQVILNLAINAADAMPKGGHLRLSTASVDVDESFTRSHRPMPVGRYVRLAISDTGVGMSAETQARIFEPFFTTKGPDKGTGLGLATVYGIVKQSEGFIWVSSQLGRGTTFEVFLPVVRDAIVSAIQTVKIPQDTRQSHTILLAEDDVAVRRLARHVLAKQGYTVLDAREGDEALAVARQYPGPIHLLIAVIVMPGLSGPDLASRLVRERPDVRVLYTSGYSENVMIRAGFDRGLTLLPKPFLPADLLGRVNELLGT